MTGGAEPSRSPLFREASAIRNSEPWLGTVAVYKSKLAAAISFSAILAAICIVVFIFSASFTSSVRVIGQLSPVQGIILVSAPQDGALSSIKVSEGTDVVKGQTLFVLSSVKMSSHSGDVAQVKMTSFEKRGYEIEKARMESRREAERQQNDLRNRRLIILQKEGPLSAQIKIVNERMDLTRRRVQAFESHREVVTAIQIQQEQDALLALNAQLEILHREEADDRLALAALDNESSQARMSDIEKTSSLVKDALTNQAEYAEASVAKEQIVSADSDGTVAGLLPTVGDAVRAGDPILRILPKKSEIEARLWVSSRGVGLVRLGQVVKIRYSAFPYQRFGLYSGRVVQLARVPEKVDKIPQLSGNPFTEPMYRVDVKLDRQFVSDNGKQMPLVPGMVVEADISLEKRRLIQWIVPKTFVSAASGI